MGHKCIACGGEMRRQHIETSRGLAEAWACDKCERVVVNLTATPGACTVSFEYIREGA